jgi:hypothetical protein
MKRETDLEATFELRLNGNEDPCLTSFDELILETVDSTLSTLGDSCKQAIYHHLQKMRNMKREDIPGIFAAFVVALENIFGKAAVLIEARIIQTLHQKVRSFRYSPQKDDLSLVGYVESLRGFL